MCSQTLGAQYLLSFRLFVLKTRTPHPLLTRCKGLQLLNARVAMDRKARPQGYPTDTLISTRGRAEVRPCSVTTLLHVKPLAQGRVAGICSVSKDTRM